MKGMGIGEKSSYKIQLGRLALPVPEKEEIEKGPVFNNMVKYGAFSECLRAGFLGKIGGVLRFLQSLAQVVRAGCRLQPFTLVVEPILDDFYVPLLVAMVVVGDSDIVNVSIG